MQNDFNKLSYLPNIHTDIYCAYKSSLSKNNWYANGQRANYSRLYFILDGTCSITIDGIEYVATKNHLVLIPANSEYSYNIQGDEPLIKLWCHFNAVIGDINLFNIINCNYMVLHQEPMKLVTLFHNLINTLHLSDTIISHLQQQSILGDILTEFLLLSSYNLSSQSFENKLHLDRVVSYMETHLKEKITVTQLASMLHLNTNYFIQVFTKNYGISPLKMLNQIKLKNIKELLEKTNIPISDIAILMGFDDISYFSKFTKKHLGLAPRDYRLHNMKQ